MIFRKNDRSRTSEGVRRQVRTFLHAEFHDTSIGDGFRGFPRDTKPLRAKKKEIFDHESPFLQTSPDRHLLLPWTPL